ncbi:MAG: YmfQ family protein [Clostridia bacterium]|jgi:hypothetical protein|nr:YmfQ family protein [Clostridia bacterium]
MKKYLEYLPEFLRDYREIKAIANAENAIFSDEEAYLNSCMSMPWVNTSDEKGIKRYESMFGIKSSNSDSLDTRKKAVKIYLNRSFVYTYKNFDEYLCSICGSDGYKFEVLNSEYKVNIKLALSVASLYNMVSENARKIIPANMSLNVEIMYNEHNDISKYTHKQLSTYTHDEIREKNITS